jgi:hypothetical protein
MDGGVKVGTALVGITFRTRPKKIGVNFLIIYKKNIERDL